MKILLCLPFFFLLAFTGFAQSEPEDTAIYTLVEEMPEFQGGEKEMYPFLAENTIYPKEMKQKTVEGVVFVSFVVEKDGSINLVKVLRSPHESLSNEAIRVVSSMPSWIPGKQGGDVVRVRYILPIRFAL